MPATELAVPLPDGTLAGLDFGGDGPGVLLVHGSGHNAAVWTDVATRLVDRCHPVAVDLRGHGQSRVDSDAPEQYWRDLAAVLDTWPGQRPVLVGHSTGGYAVAAVTAAGLAAPAAVCIVDGPVLDDRAESLRQHAALRSAETMEHLRQAFRYGWRADDEQLGDHVARSIREADDDWLNAGARPGLIEQVVRRSFVRDGSQWLRRPTTQEIAVVTDVQPDAAVFPSRDLYDQLDCPVRFVHATRGLYADRRGDVEALAGQHPGRRLTVLDASHNVAMTRPAELAEVIADVVTEHAGPAHHA